MDDNTPLDELVKDVIDDISARPVYRHTSIPLPRELYQLEELPRINSKGVDLDDAEHLKELLEGIKLQRETVFAAKTLVSGVSVEGTQHPITNPNDLNDVVGQVTFSTPDAISNALTAAHSFVDAWRDFGPDGRAQILEAWAERLESHYPELVGVISREAGRTLADCVDEIREAVDFCRYYANQARSSRYADAKPLGTVFCVSPWNFPLAIFIGQVSAALAAGNCVIAKPAEQTPTVATRAIELLLEAGCPASAIHLLQGTGADIGEHVLSDPTINGVAFTGSTLTAQVIHRSLANRADGGVPLLAETGGQNCMIVDSTALPEQVVDDVIRSGFHSAGQRCSALRVMYVQNEIADKIITMLKDACESVYVGDSQYFNSDIGPIIDQRAREALDNHINAMQSAGAPIHRIEIPKTLAKQGTFFAPALIEIDNIGVLEKEVFGPIIHVIRYKADELSDVIKQINSTGFGLTMGVHSRIETFADYVFNKTNAGNTYINRNVVGAVVGVNPFGGSGLSGTGPKAGGPAYLSRFYTTISASGKIPKLDSDAIKAHCEQLLTSSELPGPTGEENILSCHPAGLIGLASPSTNDALLGLAIYAAELGNQLVLLDASETDAAQLQAQLKNYGVQLNIRTCDIENAATANLAIALVHSDFSKKINLQRLLAASDGPIVQTIEYNEYALSPSNLASILPHLIHERTKTDNLIARGGNTQLFNL